MGIEPVGLSPIPKHLKGVGWMKSLLVSPVDETWEHTLCARIAQEAMSLVGHEALYVYWLDSAGENLWLRAMEMPANRPAVRPDYAGLVADHEYAPVPLCLTPEGIELAPRQWSEVGKSWLELPVGPWVRIRLRLGRRQRLSALHLRRLNRWACARKRDVAAAREALLPR